MPRKWSLNRAIYENKPGGYWLIPFIGPVAKLQTRRDGWSKAVASRIESTREASVEACRLRALGASEGAVHHCCYRTRKLTARQRLLAAWDWWVFGRPWTDHPAVLRAAEKAATR